MVARPVLTCVLLALAACLLPACDSAPRTLPPLEIYFSPHGGCTDAVVREINAAQSSIRVQAYSFTSTLIANALIDAHKRGVDVKVILDKKENREEYSLGELLRDAGIPVATDGIHAIAHNKIMILDGQVVLTGSFNFTKQAEHSNAENLLVIRDQATAQQYADNWLEHAAHSEPYTGAASGAAKKGTPRGRQGGDGHGTHSGSRRSHHPGFSPL